MSAIVRFRRHYADELARFRLEIDRLAASLDSEPTYQAVAQRMSDIVTNEVLPAYNGLKAALQAQAIRWFPDCFLRVTAISTTATAIPTALLGLSVPVALMVDAGISVTAAAATFWADRRDVLRRNPYTYLLALERAGDRPRPNG